MQQLNGKIRTLGAADSIKNRIKILFLVLSWLAGLLLAGSDGAWMPYINVLGGLMFLGASIGLGRVLPGLERPGRKPRVRVQVMTRPKERTSSINSLPGRVQSGYSGEFGLV